VTSSDDVAKLLVFLSFKITGGGHCRWPQVGRRGL